MKKLISSILSLALVFSLSACGNKAEKQEDQPQTEAQTEVSAPKEEKAESFTDWKAFLAEYEAWVDGYIEVVKKYKENPTDTSILTEQQSKLTELSDWANRTGEVQKELQNASPDVLKEYQEEVTRILMKLNDALK